MVLMNARVSHVEAATRTAEQGLKIGRPKVLASRLKGKSEKHARRQKERMSVVRLANAPHSVYQQPITRVS